MEMTKMLLPTAVPSMAKIHRSEKYIFYPDLKNYKNIQKRLLLSKLLREQLERKKRESSIYKVVRENCRQLLKTTSLAPNYESQRVACPSTDEEDWPNNRSATLANGAKSRKQLPQLLRTKPEPESKPVQESKPAGESELHPVLVSKPEIELESSLALKTELASKSEAHARHDSELDLQWVPEDLRSSILAEIEWKQELERESEPYSISEVWNEYDPDYAMMTTGEMCKIYTGLYDSIIDGEMDSLESSNAPIRCADLRLKECFISEEASKRMLYTTLTYKDIIQNDFQRIVGMMATNSATRSLLKSQQQNVNSTPLYTNSWPQYGDYYRQLLLGNEEKNPNRPKYREIIAKLYQQIIINLAKNEEDRDPDVMKLFDCLITMMAPHGDTVDARPIVHDQTNEQALTSRCSLDTTQRLRRRRRSQRTRDQMRLQNDIRNAHSDHSYHLNQPESSEQSDTSSESSSDEEIDVVSLGNLRQKTDDDDDDELTPCNNIAETAESANATDADVTYVNATDANALDEDEVDVSVPSTFRGRPRGRPPGPNSAKRKRTAQTAQLFSEGENDQPGPVLKRARVRNDQLADSLQNLSQQDGGDDEAKKRYNHNCMERLRRENMKASFDKLRKSIPEIAQNRKVSKVSILKHAKNYIDMWEPITKGNERTFDALIKRRQELEELAESLGIPVKKIKVKNYVTKHASFRFLAND
ncbi:uncharacterized protein Myc [Cardiocondyla obscurior]|uniref:uncharacterized protein Myc n=1 Tax=Cardiocondyla obscurior TaxID=286306 RepID=UPI0039655F2C